MKKIFILLSGVLFLGSCTSKDAKLSGAGATFPAPFYNIVFRNYTETTGNKVTYGATGSGSGIRSLKDRTVDFGATDVFLLDEELKGMKSEVLHIPTAMGAVVLAYNLEGIENIKLTAELISEIYRGKITYWNDPKIIAVNPGIKLPALIITPVYRSDGSGTTYVFTDYMSKTDEAWKHDIGTGKSLEFPKGIAAKGNPGVAAIIGKTKGALGYVGSEYAFALNIPSVLLKNRAGKFVKADTESISAAANIEIPKDTRIIITNSDAENAYPISTFTWIILYKEQAYNKRNLKKAMALQTLLKYILSEEGQKTAAKIHYAPLSQKALLQAQNILSEMTYDNKPFKPMVP